MVSKLPIIWKQTVEEDEGEKVSTSEGQGRGSARSEEAAAERGSGSEDGCFAPMRRACCQYWRQILLVICHVSIWSATFYITFVWLGSFEESLSLEGDDGVDSPFVISFGVQVSGCD